METACRQNVDKMWINFLCISFLEVKCEIEKFHNFKDYDLEREELESRAKYGARQIVQCSICSFQNYIQSSAILLQIRAILNFRNSMASH